MLDLWGWQDWALLLLNNLFFLLVIGIWTIHLTRVHLLYLRQCILISWYLRAWNRHSLTFLSIIFYFPFLLNLSRRRLFRRLFFQRDDHLVTHLNFFILLTVQIWLTQGYFLTFIFFNLLRFCLHLRQIFFSIFSTHGLDLRLHQFSKSFFWNFLW